MFTTDTKVTSYRQFNLDARRGAEPGRVTAILHLDRTLLSINADVALVKDPDIEVRYSIALRMVNGEYLTSEGQLLLATFLAECESANLKGFVHSVCSRGTHSFQVEAEPPVIEQLYRGFGSRMDGTYVR